LALLIVIVKMTAKIIEWFKKLMRGKPVPKYLSGSRVEKIAAMRHQRKVTNGKSQG
tara:strand:+ start:285 stop:452 length:168 start_codon:yes stop_codon:yes gene_type:complete